MLQWGHVFPAVSSLELASGWSHSSSMQSSIGANNMWKCHKEHPSKASPLRHSAQPGLASGVLSCTARAHRAKHQFHKPSFGIENMWMLCRRYAREVRHWRKHHCAHWLNWFRHFLLGSHPMWEFKAWNRRSPASMSIASLGRDPIRGNPGRVFSGILFMNPTYCNPTNNL